MWGLDIKVTLVGYREDKVKADNKLCTSRQEINSVGELVNNREGLEAQVRLLSEVQRQQA